jgi:hypothetical protein
MTATRKKHRRKNGGSPPYSAITRSAFTRSARRQVALSTSLVRKPEKSPPRTNKSNIKSYSQSKPQVSYNPAETTSNKPFIFLIQGLGCHKYSDFEKWEIAEYIDVEPHEIEIICDIKKPFLNIARTTCYLQPLKDDSLFDSLIDKLTESAKERDIYVYSTSFGGMIINRVAEILTKRYNDEPDKVKQDKLYILILKMHFSTFGSIYIGPEIASWIDIINYIAIGDVANTCTRNIEHKQAVNVGDIEDKYTELLYNRNRSKLAYKKRYIKERDKFSPKIVDICLYKKNKKDDTFVPNCDKRISRIPILRANHEWKVHNAYFPLIFSMMRKPTTHIESLDLQKQLDKTK